MARPEKVPYDQDGNLVRTPDNGWEQLNLTIEWQDNPVFLCALTLQPKLYWAASSKFIIWKDDEGHEYPMFASDWLALCITGHVVAGVSSGPWAVVKRGRAYGLQYVKEQHVKDEDPNGSV